ncbi:MAG TPA: hypothetical protein VGM37_00445 [Armatimonadota bacterium]|jgi:hypothetical protein
MTGRLLTIALGGNANRFIRSVLEKGSGRSLGRALLALPLEDGSVETYLPRHPGDEQLAAFRWGGIGGGQRPKSAEIIGPYLNGRPERCVVWPDGMPEYIFPGFQRSADDSLWFRLGTEPYVYLHGPGPIEGAEIEMALRHAKGYHFVCALTSWPEGTPIAPATEVTAETLQGLADRTQILLVGAYDEEAILAWRRPAQSGAGE